MMVADDWPLYIYVDIPLFFIFFNQPFPATIADVVNDSLHPISDQFDVILWTIVFIFFQKQGHF